MKMILINSCVVFLLNFFNFCFLKFYWDDRIYRINNSELCKTSIFSSLMLLNKFFHKNYLSWRHGTEFCCNSTHVALSTKTCCIAHCNENCQNNCKNYLKLHDSFLWFKSSIVLSFKQSARLLYQKIRQNTVFQWNIPPESVLRNA